jgi:diguanylate cyclase (GGDEF)-like protein
MISSLCKDIIYAGFGNEPNADIRRQIMICALFSLFSFIILILYAIDGTIRGHLQLAIILELLAVIMIGNYIYLRRTGQFRSSSIVIVFLMSSLCLYLFYSGGSGNTGHLWFFVLPSLSYFILGRYRGTIWMASLFLILAVMLFLPDRSLIVADYSPQFLERFFGSLFSVCIIAFMYEYAREDSRRELLNLSRELDQLSRRDELTGLANRRDMIERLNNELNRYERNGKNFSLLVADIDHFKMVNDKFGHECGDIALKQVASELVRNTQKRDCVARWGGEEFLILLPETAGPKAAKIAERLRLSVEQLEISCNNTSIMITVSIGIAEFQPTMTLNELINKADSLLYEAKLSGRNRVIFKPSSENSFHMVN